MLAGGGQCVADMGALRGRADLFGELASATTTWRVLRDIDDKVLDGLRRSRTQIWAEAPASGDTPQHVILDMEAALG